MSIRPRRSLQNAALKRPSALDSVPRDPELIWLDKNENLDAELIAVSHAVLTSIPPSALATYPEAGELYRKLAHWVDVSPQSLILTPGSDGAIRLVFEAFVEHGDAVVHTSPTFAMYPVYSQMFGAQAFTLEYEPGEEGPRLDPQRIIAALHEYRPKLMCLPNPDSPTGTVLDPEVLRNILETCQQTGTVFLVDEAYHPFHPWSAASWTETSRNIVVARTFAKAWGAAGLRMGYAVAHPETAMLLHKMRPMYEVSTLGVEFMSRMLDRVGEMQHSVARISESKERFLSEMRQLGFSVLPTGGNFVHVAFGEQAKAVHAALATKVLYRAEFGHPCLTGYSRFSLAPWQVMEPVADIIKLAVGRRS